MLIAVFNISNLYHIPIYSLLYTQHCQKMIGIFSFPLPTSPHSFFAGLFIIQKHFSRSSVSLCSGESFLFYLSFVLINGFYFGVLIKKHFPVFVPNHLSDVYYKMFSPLKVSKKVSFKVCSY
jgi:hypothetical protein